MQRKGWQRRPSVTSVFVRRLGKKNLCVTLTVMSCIFIGVMIVTSTHLSTPSWPEPRNPHTRQRERLSEKLQVTIQTTSNTSDDDTRSLYEKVRVLCIIVSRGHNQSEKFPHINATWGRRCNKLVFMRSAPNSKLTPLNPKYRQRSRSVSPLNTFKYVHDNHLDDADWFMKVYDDTYVIVENLRYLLVSHNSTDPVFFGHRFKSGYVSAGGGYVLSHGALRHLVEDGFEPGNCPYAAYGEDIRVSACLEKLGIKPSDSRDSQGRDRFFPILPEDLFFPDKENSLAWYWNASFYEKKVGLDCCSDEAISFCAMEPEHMYMLEYFVYHLKAHGGSHPQERASAYPFG